MIRALAVAASLLLLAGCASPVMPEPLTDAEIAERVQADKQSWWDSMFPDEPMPSVEPIEYIDQSSASSPVLDCVAEANLPGVTVGAQGIQYVGTDVNDALNRQLFICSAQYPYNPSEVGYLSSAEMEWLYYYNRDRFVPCLQMLGYSVTNQTGDYVEGSYDFWMVYNELAQVPADDWARIDLHCPQAPIGPTFYRG